jgi:cyanophycinase
MIVGRAFAVFFVSALVAALSAVGETRNAGIIQERPPAEATRDAPEIGPPNGALVIVGGAMRDPAILVRFIELAGGADAPIVVVPTAGGEREYDQYWSGLAQFKAAGIKNLTLLHTKDRAEANSEAFVEPIRKARGVFFTGGRQWHLADSYLNTLTHRELNALLKRGGVIGGTSAGASIQGSFLVRGDTKGNETMIGDHVEGLGFVRNVAIDQHLLKRNRQFDLLEVIERHPHLLGIGLDENTAIVVRGDRFEVIGQSYVFIYDNQRRIPPYGTFYALAPGDQYNLKTRKAERPVRTMNPLERVVEQKWPPARE